MKSSPDGMTCEVLSSWYALNHLTSMPSKVSRRGGDWKEYCQASVYGIIKMVLQQTWHSKVGCQRSKSSIMQGISHDWCTFKCHIAPKTVSWLCTKDTSLIFSFHCWQMVWTTFSLFSLLKMNLSDTFDISITTQDYAGKWVINQL